MTSAQRAFLRSQAQTIGSVVMVGRDGLSENVVSALDEALECHELVKVRFQAHKDEVQSISRELEKRSASALVSVTGFTAVFFREMQAPWFLKSTFSLDIQTRHEEGFQYLP